MFKICLEINVTYQFDNFLINIVIFEVYQTQLYRSNNPIIKIADLKNVQ